VDENAVMCDGADDGWPGWGWQVGKNHQPGLFSSDFLLPFFKKGREVLIYYPETGL
jgi:hypothetical protein